jgi:cytochrome c oxidase subunit 1
VSRYPTHPGWGTLNELETIGAGIIALGVLTFLINVFVSLRRRVPAGSDPWLGHTLEWATTSPPAPLNFEGPLPPIRSYAPLLDLRHQALDRERRAAEGASAG